MISTRVNPTFVFRWAGILFHLGKVNMKWDEQKIWLRNNHFKASVDVVISMKPLTRSLSFAVRLKSELQELQTMKNDAIIARDIAKSQLEDQEKEVYAERRKRELELHKVRKEADEKKMMQERYQYRIVSLPFCLWFNFIQVFMHVLYIMTYLLCVVLLSISDFHYLTITLDWHSNLKLKNHHVLTPQLWIQPIFIVAKYCNNLLYYNDSRTVWMVYF